MKENVVQNKVKRYLVFLLGLFVNSLGVALITKADLGTSLISSIPYVLSLSFPFSLGQFTIFFSILLIVLQLVILGRNFKAEHLLQIPVSLVFGYFIDLCMLLLFFVQPAAYVLKILYLLVGCIVLGIVLTGHLNGVREGTVIAALLVGFIARLIGKKLSFLPEMLFGAEPAEDKEAPQSTAEEPICIAVGRQFGSGGHDISKKLADRLGFAFYDEELIQMAAGTTGYQPEFIAKTEEKMSHSLLYDLVSEMYSYSDQYQPPKDNIFEAEVKSIREAAQKNSVIVGRCADWVLRNNPRCVRVFLHAPLEYRIRTVMQREHLTDEKAARHHIQQTDKQRADNYRYYTRTIWGASANYHLCIDTSLGEDYVENLILGLVDRIKADPAKK